MMNRKRLVAALVSAIFTVVAFTIVLTANAADVVLVKDGECDYSLVTTTAWRHVDQNEELYNELLSVLKAYTGAEFPFRNANNMISQREIYLGFAKESGKQKDRIAENGTYLLDPELVGADGWAIRTFGERIAIMTVQTSGSEVSRDALYYFLKNCLGYDPENIPSEPLKELTVPETNIIHSRYLDSDRVVALTLGGVDVGEFVIVCSENASEAVSDSAAELRRVLFALTGRELGIVSDSTPAAEHEIILGSTTRTSPAACDSVIKTEGGNLIIGGKNDEGFLSAYEAFLRDHLHIEGRRFTGEGDIALSDIAEESDGLFLGESECRDPMPYFRHNIASLLGTAETPCFSDPATAEKLIAAIEAKAPADKSTVYLINNTSKYCDCGKCGAEAFFSCVNHVAEHFAERSITVATLAYKETAVAPAFEMADNVLVYFAAPDMCCAHAISDSSCPENAKLAAAIGSWEGKAKRIYVLDFSQDYSYFPSTFPNFGVLSLNMNYYNSHVQGVRYVWDKKNAALEYGDLRLRALEHLLSHRDISPEDFTEYLDMSFSDIYGGDASAVSEYAYRFADASAEHFTVKSRPDEILPVVRREDGKYDLTLAKELYRLWKGIYRRHEAPAEDLNGLAEVWFARSYRYSDYYPALHSRVQLTAWLRYCVDTLDKYDVFRELAGA